MPLTIGAFAGIVLATTMESDNGLDKVDRHLWIPRQCAFDAVGNETAVVRAVVSLLQRGSGTVKMIASVRVFQGAESGGAEEERTHSVG